MAGEDESNLEKGVVKAIIKAAKRVLKKLESNGETIKMAELARKVVFHVAASDVTATEQEIKATIRNNFLVGKGQVVKSPSRSAATTTTAETKSPKKRSLSAERKESKDRDVAAELPAIKPKKRKKKVQQDQETQTQTAIQVVDAAPLSSSSTSASMADWRAEHKIVLLHTPNTNDADKDDVKQQQQLSLDLQTDATYFPWCTFEGIGSSDAKDDNNSSSANGKIHSAFIHHCTVVSKFTKPSPIQAQSWPILTQHRDMVGIAETGSGKTLAFALPALSSMAGNMSSSTRNKGLPRLLVLSPTRELAMQSAAVLEEFGAVVGLRSLTVYGGVPKHTQVAALRSGAADCVVATPGRLKDLIQEKSCRLHAVEHLVLDEADRMLDMGFEEDVRFIISQCGSKERRPQTAMFSATWPAAIQAIAMEFMHQPVRVYVGFASIVAPNDDSNNDVKTTASGVVGVDDSLSANRRVQQIVEVLEDRQREARLRQVLQLVHTGKKSQDRVLVFALYKMEADRLEQALRRDGWKCNSIHGNKNQQARTAALSAFKDGSCPLLVATDVAARGLDIPNVEAVINYTFPLTIEDYVHRIGRTGRAGKTGISYTFFQPTDKSHAGELQQVLKQVGQPIPDDLAKFGCTIKKKEHKMYGNFGPKDGITKKATKITFNYDEDE